MANRSLSTFLNQGQPYALALFRVVFGLLFVCHGAGSLFGALDRTSVPSGTWPNWYSAVIELVCGTLIVLGVGTRAAAFLASGAMAYAYFKVHQPEGLFPIQNSGEMSAMFCWAFLLLVFTGPGALALDRLFVASGEGRTGQDHNDRSRVSA